MLDVLSTPVVIQPELPAVADTEQALTAPDDAHVLLFIANKKSMEEAIRLAETLAPRKAIINAEDGKTYSGKILVATELHVVQNNGSTVIVHNKVDLDRIPEKNEITDVKYKGGKGVVAARKIERGGNVR